MNKFRCYVSLGVKSETEDTGYSIERIFPFVPQLGTNLMILGMDSESTIVYVGYFEQEMQEGYFVIDLSAENLNQHQIRGLIENGWKEER